MSKINPQKEPERPAVCEWYGYRNTRCRLNCVKSQKFCKLHIEYLKDFNVYPEDTEELCGTYRDVKIKPRSYKHLKGVMSMLGISERFIQVKTPCNDMEEEADISNQDYIEMTMDNSRYYYANIKGELKARDLRLLFKEYCDEKAKVNVRGTVFCSKCYTKEGIKKPFPALGLLNTNLKENSTLKETTENDLINDLTLTET